MSTVVVAMSGGVDSSVTAALLHEQGYRVIGLTMRLWTPPETEGIPRHSYTDRCCSLETIEDARAVCDAMGVPFYALNFESDFQDHVINYFVHEYLRGRTPNPCLACNKWMKFEFLLRRAEVIGADYLATGHYARVQKEAGEYRLLKGVDKSKDQSYVLYMLQQGQLERLLLPLGAYEKTETRAMAAKFNLPVAEKAESQEICFIQDNDYRRFLRDTVPEALQPGPILDVTGKVIGEHEGIAFFTIGQRRGLRLSSTRPLYVVDIDAKLNAVTVGSEDHLWRCEFLVDEVRFVSEQEPVGTIRAMIKIRYRSPETPGTVITGERGQVRVVLDEPQRAITPGQAAVFYDREYVLGGGIIAGFPPSGIVKAEG